jgi:hypothetical protein
MKRQLIPGLAALALWPVDALGQNVVVVPYVAPVPQVQTLSVPGQPLEEWVDPALGSTASFAHRCGHAVEVHLWGNRVKNYATFIVTNSSGADSRIGNRPRVVLEDGREKWLEPWSGNREVRHGISEIVDYAFPAKEDFEGQSLLTLVLPLEQGGETCELYFALQRRPGAPDALETVTDHTAFGIQLGGGVGFVQSGTHQGITGTPGAFFLSFGYYPWVRHGFHLHMLLEGYRDGSGRQFAPDVPESALSHTLFSLAYAYRRRLFKPLNLAYRIGPAFSAMEVTDDEDPLVGKVGVAVMQSVHLDLAWRPILFGQEDGPFGFGLAAYHVYTPSVELSGIDLSGHRVGALLLFNVGG